MAGEAAEEAKGHTEERTYRRTPHRPTLRGTSHLATDRSANKTPESKEAGDYFNESKSGILRLQRHEKTPVRISRFTKNGFPHSRADGRRCVDPGKVRGEGRTELLR